jgi:CRISPR-associated protein Cas2
MRSHFILAYDIADPGRLRQVARIAQDFGERVQLSVFACQLSPKDVAVLRERLRDVVVTTVDQVLLFRLGPVAEAGHSEPEFEVIGRPVKLRDMRGLVF